MLRSFSTPLLILTTVFLAISSYAADATAAAEGQKLEQQIKELLIEADKFIKTDKGITHDQKALEDGIKILEKAESLATRASEIDADKYDKLAQTVAMKLYGARKNTTLHLADSVRKTTPPPAVPVTEAKPVAATAPPAPPVQPAPSAPQVGSAPPVQPATPAVPPVAPAAPQAPVVGSRSEAAREAAAQAQAPAAPSAPAVAVMPPASAAPPITRHEKVFKLKDGRQIIALRVIDSEDAHVIKDITGKTQAIGKDEVAEIIERDVVVGGGAAGTVSSTPAKKAVKVFVLKDGRTINAVKVLDVGDQLSIKDDRNLFIVIEKSDIVETKP